MRSGWTSNNCRIKWRTMAAEETRRVEKRQWCGNGQTTMVAEGQRRRRRHQRKNNNQLMCSGKQATTVGWGGGQQWLKRWDGWKNNSGMATNKQLCQWWRGDDGTDNNDNKTTINKYVAAEAEDYNGWQEAGPGGGGGGGTCHAHLFTWWILGGIIRQSYLLEACPK